MLENIYDIAPGAGLAFATGDVGDVCVRSRISRHCNRRPGQA